MKSVFYCEDDFVAGLLKQYFVGNGNITFFVKRSSNGNLAQQIEANAVDLFLAQSDDCDRLSKILVVNLRALSRARYCLVPQPSASRWPFDFLSE